MINVAFVNPLIAGVYEVFGTLLSAKAHFTKVIIADPQKPPGQVMAVIGLSGEVRGTVAMLFSQTTVDSILVRLIGETAPADNEIVCDAMAETVNMVAGFAKAKLSTLVGSTLELTLPTVIRGQSYQVYAPSGALWIEIQFDSDLGPFCLRVSFDHLPNM